MRRLQATETVIPGGGAVDSRFVSMREEAASLCVSDACSRRHRDGGIGRREARYDQTSGSRGIVRRGNCQAAGGKFRALGSKLL